jgi:phosphatidate cytidylyltransferase
MLVRILTGLVLIPVVVILVWWAPPAILTVAAAIVAGVALLEFFDLGERIGLHGFRMWTIVCTAAIFYGQHSLGLEEAHTVSGGVSIIRQAAGGTLSIDAVLLIFLFGAVAIGLGTRRSLHDVLPGIAISSAGLLFIALPFSYIVRIYAVGHAAEHMGRQLVLFTLALVWAGDIFAYFVGHSLGHLPMAPALSPNKTWEGAFANVIGSLLVAILFAKWMQADTYGLLITAALANIAGQAGDLIESAYKRGAVVKDSSSLLPGHGGMLDRIDSLILASPVVWVVFQWFSSR